MCRLKRKYKDKEYFYNYDTVNVVLNETQRNMLNYISSSTGMSASKVIRHGIQMQYNRLKYDKEPKEKHDYTGHF